MKTAIPKINSQMEAIKYFIEEMDIEMIDLILKNDITYQDFKKDVFICKLKNLFYEFMEHGDSHLISIAGHCLCCFKDKEGFTFLGDKSNNYVSIIFDTKNGEISDLCECSRFKHKDNSIKLNKRLYIDKREFPFL